MVSTVLGLQRDKLNFLLKTIQQHGDVVKFSLPGLSAYLFNDPEHIEEVGNSFAMMELVLVVASLAKRFRFSLLDNQPLQFISSVTLRPKNGVPLRLSARSPLGATK